jgi:cellulose synthase/poly-beta-1,6-N-acetylglucosamine synthase-like glycosyltransferase/peptidoglycan/xylan/chitin deacetylase (PgdA/CDA1 family)
MRAPSRESGHWWLLGFSLVVLVLMLLLQGISIHTLGASRTASDLNTGPAELPKRGSTLTVVNGRLAPLSQSPGRRVALTFDDGPSRWTGRIAAVLRRHHVPATFFVVGAQAVRHPGPVRALQRQGFELGNHTFTHVDPAAAPGWERTRQASMTQAAVGGITGIRARLYRPPYSSFPFAVTRRDASAYLQLARQGYLITLSDYDGEDWRRPGVAEIVRNATPPGRQGGIVLLHDGGGDRSQTLAAVRRLIPKLKRRGFQFVTVSQLAGLPQRAVDVPATANQRVRGDLLVGALHVAAIVTRIVTIAVLLIGVLTAVRMLLIFVLARQRSASAGAPRELQSVSIVVPAYDEEKDIAKCVASLAASDYPGFEVLVVDDGSTDATADVVQRLALARVRLVRQLNAGKPAALNRGIAEAQHDLIVSVDADTVFEPGTLRALVAPFADPRTGAISGQTKVSNRRRLLGRWQHIEYVMGFNLDRRMFAVLSCVPTVPGAIGAFRRRALLDVGGFSADTLAEDTDVALAMCRSGWRVAYQPDARAWTEAPATLSALWRQRYRWAYGTLQNVWKHRRATRLSGQRRVGLVALPYISVFHIALPCLAPLIDLFAIYGLIFLDPIPVLIYWLGFNVSLGLLALYAFRLDREPLHPLWALPVQQFVYRQLMYLVVFQSVVTAARGVHLRWQRIHRTGELGVPGPGATPAFPARTSLAGRVLAVVGVYPPTAGSWRRSLASGSGSILRPSGSARAVHGHVPAWICGTALLSTAGGVIVGSDALSRSSDERLGALLLSAARTDNAFVRVNQVGYEPAGTKRGFLISRIPDDGARFEVVDTSGDRVLDGRATPRGAWNRALPRVSMLDFSRLRAPGIYRIIMRGKALAVSPPFRIGSARQLYAPLLADSVYFFSAQRDGPKIARHVLNRQPSHLNDRRAIVYRSPHSKRALEHGDFGRVGRTVDISGGWFDAGDYLKFVQTASFADTLMLFSLRDGAGLPSGLRAEARFGTDWLDKMWDRRTRTLYYQVGLGDGTGPRIVGDHDAWAAPEVDDRRPVRKPVIDPRRPIRKHSAAYFLRYRPVFRAGPPRSPVSPNLAGRLAAAFGLCAQVYRTSDPTYARRCLLEGQTVFDAARTRDVGKLLTATPHDYYPEAEWRDDMELGATELYLATAALRGAPALHRDPHYYLRRAAKWANAYMSGPNAGADSLNLYDVSFLAHYELFKAIKQAGQAQKSELPDLAVGQRDLLGGMRSQLRAGVARQSKDPFGLSNPYGLQDTVPHALGYALAGELYGEIVGTSPYEPFASNQRDWVLGANAWGSSFVVGAGSTYPRCLAHKVANLAGSLDGRPPMLRGAAVGGPSAAVEFENAGAPDGHRSCPVDGRDPFVRFNGRGMRYDDNVTTPASSEPSDDYTALALALFARETRR